MGMNHHGIRSIYTRFAFALGLILCATAGGAAAMTAGVAKAVITNDTPLVMVNGEVSDGVLHDIYARTLVLNDGGTRLVIVTYDLNCLDVATPILRTRVKKELGIEQSELILLATHNHNAPIQIVPDNFAYGRWLADTIFGTIKEAIANEQGPVVLEFGNGYGYFLTSTGNAPVDYEIQLLKVTRDGQPIAMLFNHGTHPMQASAAKVGAGHPGYAMDIIEERIPGVQAMYADQCGGNQFPGRLDEYRIKIRKARKKGSAFLDAMLEERARALGLELADAVLDIASSDLRDVTGPITTSMERFDLPLAAPMSYEEAKALYAKTVARRKIPDDVGFVAYPNKYRNTNWMRMLLRYYEEGIPFPKTTGDMICTDDTYLIHKEDKAFLKKYDDSIHDELPCIYNEVIVAKIGPMPFVAIQGEVCAPIGARIKDTFRRTAPPMIFGYMGEHNLYIPTREIVRLDAYQSQVIRIQYASPVGWDPSVEDVTVKGVVRMVKDILKEDSR